jgi:hypothetical protein
MNRYTTVLLVILLISATSANAATKGSDLVIIKVISSTTKSIPLDSDNNGAPKDCNLMDFSAYCHHSRSAIVRHTMVVQDSAGKSATVSCTVDSIWSKCVALPEGVTFSAQWVKHGLAIRYPNAKGKEVKQLYALVPAADISSSAEGSKQNSSPAKIANSAGATTFSEANRDTVTINFTSTPADAEITLDGSYVGNAPSTIAVGPGRHLVVLAMPGFAKWKRELMVSLGSDVNVTATLEKTSH